LLLFFSSAEKRSSEVLPRFRPLSLNSQERSRKRHLLLQEVEGRDPALLKPNWEQEKGESSQAEILLKHQQTLLTFNRTHFGLLRTINVDAGAASPNPSPLVPQGIIKKSKRISLIIFTSTRDLISLQKGNRFFCDQFSLWAMGAGIPIVTNIIADYRPMQA
jgi:hypothetical protein